MISNLFGRISVEINNPFWRAYANNHTENLENPLYISYIMGMYVSAKENLNSTIFEDIKLISLEYYIFNPS